MVFLVQAASSYLLKEQPKQLFVGAELCARWYQIYTGSLDFKATDRVISYAREAQDVFSWILAGHALSTLVGRVSEKKFDTETTAVFSELMAQAASCGDVVINKFFNSPIPRFKVLGFVSDTVGDVLSIVPAIGANRSLSRAIEAAKAVASLCLTLLSAGVYYGAQTYFMPRVSLVLETTVFMAKFVHFSFSYKSQKDR